MSKIFKKVKKRNDATTKSKQIMSDNNKDCFKSQRLDSLQANVVHLRTQGPLVYKMCLKKEFEKEKEVMLKLPDIFLEQPKPLQLSPKKTYPEVSLESHREKIAKIAEKTEKLKKALGCFHFPNDSFK